MKKILLTIGMIFMLCIPAGAFDGDKDNNGYLDEIFGGTNEGTFNPYVAADHIPLDVLFDDNTDYTEPAVTFTRTYNGTAFGRTATALFRNTGDIVGGDDYQNEVHIKLQAGSTANHRKYFNFLQYDGSSAWVQGCNASNNMIMYDDLNNLHRMIMYAGAATLLNSGGTEKVRINYHPAETTGTGGLSVYSGGVAPQTLIHNLGATGYSYYVGTDPRIVYDADGDLGVGKEAPSYKVDIETASGESPPFRFVYTDASSWTAQPFGTSYITTGTNVAHQFHLTDQDNNDARMVFLAQGSAGSIPVIAGASSGKVGLNTETLTSQINLGGSLSMPIVTKTADYTATISDSTIILDATSNTVTLTLPTAVGITGRLYFVKCIDSTSTVTIDAAGTETIDGTATIVLTVSDSKILQSDGANWVVF